MQKQIEEVLSQEIIAEAQNLSIANLNVMATANQLREQKPENIIYVKLKISEDGMEWNRTETNEGEVDTKLLPE